MLITSFFVKRPQKPKVCLPGRISKSLQKSQLSTKTSRLSKTVLFALSENGINIAFAIRDSFCFPFETRLSPGSTTPAPTTSLTTTTTS